MALESLRQSGDAGNAVLSRVLKALVEVCETEQRPDEAAKWRGEWAVLQASTKPATRPTTQATQPASTPAR